VRQVASGVAEPDPRQHAGEHERLAAGHVGRFRHAFDQVQDLLAEQARSGGREQKTRHRALLQDLLTCAHCGCRMTYTWTRRGGATGKDSRVHGYYSCHRSRERGAGTCPMPHLPAHATEQLLLEEIAAICRDETLAETVIDRAATDHRQARATAEQALAEAQTELDASLAAQRREDAPRTRDAVRAAEAQAALAAQTLAELAQPLDPAAARQALARFEDLWAELAHDERRRLLRSLIQGVRIDGEQGRLHIDFATTGIAALARRDDDHQAEAEPQEGAETPELRP